MKINVEFDLDWVEDEDTIDSAVSRKIIDKAVSKVGENIIEAIKKNVDNQLANKIDDYLQTVLTGFMDRNIIITDKWGNEVSRYESVNEMLEERFDNFMSEEVDSNGKTSKQRGCSVNGSPRIDHLARKHIDSKINEITVETNKKIVEYFSSKISAAKANIHKETIDKYIKAIDFEAGIKGKA